MSKSASVSNPLQHPAVALAAAEVVRKAEAVGLLDSTPDFEDLSFADVLRAAARVRDAGIGAGVCASLRRTDPDDHATLARLLCEIDAHLEESPVPVAEWPRLSRLLERDLLARLLRVSPSSLVRYGAGERRTPDEVAARLHFLALVTGDLAGAYNDIGIRRWFDRPRAALDGRTPAALLDGEWQPEHEGAQRVRALARALVFGPAT